jgi:hypothetical protein
MSQLDPDDRALLAMRYGAGFSANELAVAVDKSPAARIATGAVNDDEAIPEQLLVTCSSDADTRGPVRGTDMDPLSH